MRDQSGGNYWILSVYIVEKCMEVWWMGWMDGSWMMGVAGCGSER